MKRIVFISSSGGHLREILQLQPIFKDYTSILITEKQKYKIDVNIKKSFLPKINRTKVFSFLFIMLYICFKSFFYFLKYKPDVIITTGSCICVPFCLIGKFFNKKLIFIESIARVKTKSLTGKIIYKHCDYIFVQWKDMLKVYNDSIYLGKIL